MVKIENFYLSGYKNIELAELSFNNFNVIIGPNNSGKSNFIQSISFLNYIINSPMDTVEKDFERGLGYTHFNEIAPFNLVEESFKSPKEGVVKFQLKISNSETKRYFWYNLKIHWSAEDFDVKYKIVTESLQVKDFFKTGAPKSVFTRVDNKIKYGTGFSAKASLLNKAPKSFSVIRILKLLVQDQGDYLDAVDSLNSVIGTPIFYFSNTELLKSNKKDQVNEFNGRTVSYNLKDEILKLEENSENWEIFRAAVKNILNIDHVSIFRYNLDVDEEGNKGGKLLQVLYFNHLGIDKKIDQLSDGTVLMIAIIAKILVSTNDIFFIEEPENSTHPKALVNLISFFKSFSLSKQFVISSHSIAILNKTNMNDIITSCVKENGFSEFYNVNTRLELKNRLKQSHINFSDELFFNSSIEEDEFL